jgi:hypothetical protein
MQTDEVVLFEVMVVEALDRAWWSGLRERLQRELDQQELLIRAHEVERI